jgi:hypothetical protein
MNADDLADELISALSLHDRASLVSWIAAVIDQARAPLVSLLRESKRSHFHCDDSWYCCRACRHPDHGLEEDEHLGKNPDSVLCDGSCTCGVDAWNKKIDEVLS